MSRLQSFLEELTDQELVNFYHYRYQEFLKDSKSRIDSEIDKRGLDEQQMNQFNHFPKYNSILEGNGEYCPRCISSKFYTSHELESITYSTVEFEVDYRVCLVCLYSAEKDGNEKSYRSVSGFGFLRSLINRKR